MGQYTPSTLRREGREAFGPNVSDEDILSLCPYKFQENSIIQDWIDGWKEGEKLYLAEQKREKEKEERNQPIDILRDKLYNASMSGDVYDVFEGILDLIEERT